MPRLGLVISFSLLSAQLIAADLTGRVRLTVDGELLAADEARDAVIYVRPSQAHPTEPVAPQTMVTRRKQFDPEVLVITPGTEVSFPNTDPILHNAFSVSNNNRFDVGLYGEGESESVQFDTPGLVRVYCNVHHSMVAHIVVVDTPWFTQPDSQGNFSLRDVPETGELFVWHPRTDVYRRRVIDLSELASQAPLDIELAVTRRKVPQHTNKFGKSYRRERRRRSY
ncbi:MAG: hypothetical protein DHS20C11_37500 [Lysobacteraceae bacterium]|nr:MAG: hypothetical protein DHS20C11_37500 [Xanthomonadaceae bacterium]